MLDTAGRLLLSVQFQEGLRVGVGALAAGVVAGALWVRWRRTPAPLAGLLVAGGTLAALPVTRSVPTEVWVGIGLLAAGGLASAHLPARWLTDPLLAAPGAYLVAFGAELPGAAWIPPFVLGAVLVAAPLVAAFDRHHPGWGPPLLALSVIGVLVCVPETEEALVLAGVALPLALLGWPVALASLGRAGSYAAVGAVLWVIAWGGWGRPGSIVGAAAALGILVVAPLVRGPAGSTLLDRLPRDWKGTVLAGLVHLPVVYLASRWAGFERDPGPAATMALGVGVAAAAVLWLGGPRSRAR